jgi:transketolase
VQAIDGHDPKAINIALNIARQTEQPSMIACKTHIALGHAAQDTSKGHGALTDAKQLADAKAAYGWNHGAFEIPADVRADWKAIGARGTVERLDWEARFKILSHSRQNQFNQAFSGETTKKLGTAIRLIKKEASKKLPKVATRKASESTLTKVNPVITHTVGGSADLTGSNNTKTDDMGVFNPENRKGRYIYFGIREHGMAAALNGIALHGGLRPYGGTFMCFTDYARGAMRLSALMGVPTVYVMTHDSIGLGEDGPTHQPVEHLAISRATPNTLVFRPADVTETAEAWEVALSQSSTPTVMALSRQSVPAVRTNYKTANLSARGAYILAEATGKRQVILMATGTEVSLAIHARDLLQADGVGTRVVSMPCMELFAQQDALYRRRILPGGAVRVAVEAAVRMGWDQWLLGERGRESKAGFIGMTSFGASAPAEHLYQKFGITAEAISEKARSLL